MRPSPSLVRSRIGNRLVHPGEILLSQFMQPFEISQNALALRMGVAPCRINQIVLGKRAITPETALMLAEVFGISAHYWMGLQADYDLACAEQAMRSRPQPETLPFLPIARGNDITPEDLERYYDVRRHRALLLERERKRRP